MTITENKITIGTTALYYKKWEVENAKQTIILLHDSLGCTVLWREWPQELAEALQMNVISYDRRGYGLSDNYTVKRPIDYLEQEAEILYQLMKHWQLHQPIVFGFSDGASVATIYAGMFPDGLSKLIVEGVHVLLEEQTLQGVRDAKTMLETTKIAKVLEKYHGDKVMDLYTAWTDTWLSEQHQTWNIQHFIPKIKVPVFVFQGENDEFGSMNQINAFDSASNHVTKWIVKDAGHTAHKEKKDVVFAAIVNFINETHSTNEKMD